MVVSQDVFFATIIFQAATSSALFKLTQLQLRNLWVPSIKIPTVSPKRPFSGQPATWNGGDFQQGPEDGFTPGSRDRNRGSCL